MPRPPWRRSKPLRGERLEDIEDAEKEEAADRHDPARRQRVQRHQHPRDLIDHAGPWIGGTEVAFGHRAAPDTGDDDDADDHRLDQRRRAGEAKRRVDDETGCRSGSAGGNRRVANACRTCRRRAQVASCRVARRGLWLGRHADDARIGETIFESAAARAEERGRESEPERSDRERGIRACARRSAGRDRRVRLPHHLQAKCHLADRLAACGGERGEVAAVDDEEERDDGTGGSTAELRCVEPAQAKREGDHEHVDGCRESRRSTSAASPRRSGGARIRPPPPRIAPGATGDSRFELGRPQRWAAAGRATARRPTPDGAPASVSVAPDRAWRGEPRADGAARRRPSQAAAVPPLASRSNSGRSGSRRLGRADDPIKVLHHAIEIGRADARRARARRQLCAQESHHPGSRDPAAVRRRPPTASDEILRRRRRRRQRELVAAVAAAIGGLEADIAAGRALHRGMLASATRIGGR